jgi:hypothetical protein
MRSFHILLALSGFALLAGALLPIVAQEECLRLPRASSHPGWFTTNLSQGYWQRWLARLRNPTFCRMTFCHGSCADPLRSIYDSSIVGTPSLFNGDNEAPVSITPCGLRTFHCLLVQEENQCCPPRTATSVETSKKISH